MKPHWMDWISLESSNAHYSVYVIELSHDVLREKKFRDKNPEYKTGMKCLYVGATGLDPIIRFEKHKAGIKSNVYVQKYGIKLLPNLYEKYNTMEYEECWQKEKELAAELRILGFAVWSA